jgi:hypothetical protein
MQSIDRSKTPRQLFDEFTQNAGPIHSYQGCSWETRIPELENKTAALIFLDAGHGEHDVRRDVLHWLQYADVENTIICGDDYWEGDDKQPPFWPGLYGVVNWLASKKLRRPVTKLGSKLWAILPSNLPRPTS